MKPLQVVCSVGVVSYGWDEPIVSCAILARPTMSLALYLQQVGRVLRPWPAPTHHPPGPRPYQLRLMDDLRTAIAAGCRRPLIVAPTGSGKSWVAGKIAEGAIAKGKGVGFLVNRRNLVLDLSKRLDKLGIDHGVIMGSHWRRRPDLRIHVASIDTLHRRENLPRWDLLFLDEAHFSLSPIWHRVVGQFGDTPLVGMTATPIRSDGRGLGRMYERILPGPSVQELIDQQYLVATDVYCPEEPNLAGVDVDKRTGDYNARQLADACDQKTLVGNIVDHWRTYGQNRRTVCFPVSVAHSKHLVEQFRRAGVEADHVDANTSDDDRRRIWERLNLGAERLPAKQAALILDHTGNTLLHGFAEQDRNWTLDDSGPTRSADRESRVRAAKARLCSRCKHLLKPTETACPKCGKQLVMQHVPEEAEGQLRKLEKDGRLRSVAEWRSRTNQDERYRMYCEWADLARKRGYKPGYATAKYVAVFGQMPPYDWRQSA